MLGMMKLTKSQVLAYQQKWKRVELARDRELRKTPISLKFKQLCFLMNSFRFMFSDDEKENEISEVRRRWTALKKRRENGWS